MKKILITIIAFTFFTFSGFAQKAPVESIDTTYAPDLNNKKLVVMEIKTSDGRLIKTGRLLDGKNQGVFRTYDEFSNISEIQEFYDGMPDGIYLQFASNGALTSEENYSKGLLNGKKVVYRFGGVKKLTEYYLAGKLDGIKITFYDNGFKQEESNYKNGLRDGVSKWFNESEILSIEYNYRRGKLHGPAKTNYYSGNVESEGSYDNDLENGEWKYYDPNGKHIRSVFFEKGKQVKEVKN